MLCVLTPTLYAVMLLVVGGCAAPHVQKSRSVPLVRWECHGRLDERSSDVVGWIGLRVGNRVIHLVKHPRSGCAPVDRSRYDSYDVPRDALTAAAGWYAGGGEQFYVVLRGSSLVVYHRTEDEGVDIPPYTVLRRIPLQRSAALKLETAQPR